MSSLAESLKELWDTYGIKGLIILSLCLQSFLILFAPLRKQIGGKWVLLVTIPLWIAYLLADWVAVFTIGLIMRAERSGILALWSSFLLLHLGGPDTITSFSLEDNELWIRHLLGLFSRVASSVYIIFLAPSNDMLWLPTLLVLLAGIIKYAERNCAFYLASFGHFGNNWKRANEYMPPVPIQFSKLVMSWKPKNPTPNPNETIKGKAFYAFHRFMELGKKIQSRMGYGSRDQGNHHTGTKTESGIPTRIVALYLLGVIKNLLVGPPSSSFEELVFPNEMHKMLRAIEIHLSLLYELLHTKLPVVDSMTGYVCRMVNFGCILGALVSFSFLKNHHYKLLKFDIWLTYGLLIGALALDLICITLLISSDWFTMAHFQEKGNSTNFINKRRWSNSVPQLNIFNTCHLLNKEEGLDFLGLRGLVQKIKRTQWVKFESFKEDQEWNFIFRKLQEKKKDKGNRGSEGINNWVLQWEASLHFSLKIFSSSYQKYVSTLEKFEYVETLLIWHIVTEFYLRDTGSGNSSSSASASNGFDYRRICKLLSDYMFYLLVMEPTMISNSPNSWKIVFEGTHKHRHETFGWLVNQMGSEPVETFFGKKDRIFNNQNDNDDSSRVKAAYDLAEFFHMERKNRQFSWEQMAEIWVGIVCHAAKNCQPIVHARQVSRGGQLLTLIWLLMNYFGLTPKNTLLTYEPSNSV
ncbi:hypothetical protein SLA2020_081460 [Shorea laevis]